MRVAMAFGHLNTLLLDSVKIDALRNVFRVVCKKGIESNSYKDII